MDEAGGVVKDAAGGGEVGAVGGGGYVDEGGSGVDDAGGGLCGHDVEYSEGMMGGVIRTGRISWVP